MTPRIELINDSSCSPYDNSNNKCRYYEPNTMKDAYFDERDQFSLFCINSQGLRAHWDSFYNLLFDMCDETHCFFTNNSKEGVGLYIKDTYKYELRKYSIFIPNIFESIFIELIVHNKHIIVGTVYRPKYFI